MVASYTPSRGHFVRTDFNPSLGREQAGSRPAVVLSDTAYNARTGLAVLCPITGQPKGYPFEVPIPDGLPVYGVVLVDAVKSLDWRKRGVEFLGVVPEELMAVIHLRLCALFHIKVA